MYTHVFVLLFYVETLTSWLSGLICNQTGLVGDSTLDHTCWHTCKLQNSLHTLTIIIFFNTIFGKILYFILINSSLIRFYGSPHYPYHPSWKLIIWYTINNVCFFLACFKRVCLKILCSIPVGKLGYMAKRRYFCNIIFRWTQLYNKFIIITANLFARSDYQINQPWRFASRLIWWSSPGNSTWSHPLDQVTVTITYMYI